MNNQHRLDPRRRLRLVLCAAVLLVAAPALAALEPSAGSWLVGIERDAEGAPEAVHLLLPADAATGAAAGAAPPTLVVACRGGNVSVFVNTRAAAPEPEAWEPVTVGLSHDAGPSGQVPVIVGSGRDTLFFFDAPFAALALADDARLEVTFPRAAGEAGHASFPLAGLDDALAPVREACPVLGQIEQSGAAAVEQPVLGGMFGIEAPRLLETASLSYPEAAATGGAEGKVLLRAVIGEQGEVTADVVGGSETESLRSAALAAVRGWRFEPARYRGGPVPALVDVIYEFRLDGRRVDHQLVWPGAVRDASGG
jgi:TonB family protein